jgi:hypothetical protein
MLRLIRCALALALVVSASAIAAPCAGFTDVDDTGPFCPNVTWIRNRNITLGCEAGLYCPTAPVSRLAMAAFLNRLGDVVLPPNVIWVAPAGGQFQSIQAAIDHLANLPLNTGGLVKLAPGAYVEQLTIPGNVAVEGAGRALSEIRSQGTCGAGPPMAGGVTLNDGAQLRKVHVSRITSDLVGDCAAIVIRNGTGAALDDVLVRIEGAGGIQHGIRIDNAGLDHPLVIDNVEVRASGHALSSAWLIGVSALGSSDRRVILRNMDISANGPVATGIALSDVTARIERVTVAAASFAPSATALAVDANPLSASEILVQSSTLRTTPAGIAATRSGIGTLRIATSLLQGATFGATACFGNYDQDLAPVAC